MWKTKVWLPKRKGEDKEGKIESFGLADTNYYIKER